MSSGGINVSQPIVGSLPASSGGAVGSGAMQPQAAYAGPITAGTQLTSPAATTGTSFVPVAGQQAGSVVASGGDVSIPRTAAIAAGVTSEALQQQNSLAAVQAQVAGQQVVDPSALQAAQAGAANVAKGPAAWNDEWAKKFKDAGAPAEIIQQLTFTGAMGADEAQLQQMLDQISGEIDSELAKFEHEHPEVFQKLRGNKDVDRSMIAQIAAASNAGQLPEDQLDQMADSIGKSQGKMLFDMFVKPMIVWSLIPGWGALRLLPAPFTGGKDILTGEKMFGDPMSTTMTLLMAAGGAGTLWANAKGAMQVAQGHRMIAQAGSDAAAIGAREGLANLSLGKKIWSFVPGTELNQQIAGLSRLDDIKAGIGNLKGVQQELAQNLYNKVVSGDVLLWGDSASKWTKMGYQPNQRGFLMGHIMGKKGAAEVLHEGARPTVLLELRTQGKLTAAQFASLGVDFADDAAKAVEANGVTVGANLKSRMLEGIDSVSPTVTSGLKKFHLGQASQQLLDAGAIARPTGFGKVLGALRPTALQDSIWAADDLAKGISPLADKFGMHGWAAIPKLAKIGMGGAALAGLGYFMMIKPQQDAKKEAEKQAAEAAAQQQAQGGAGTGGAIDPSTLSAADQQALQQFAAMPAEQQAQIIQQQYAQLQQAMQTPNLTADQQQQIAAAQAELQLLMQVAQGGAGAVASGQMQAPAAGAGAASGSAMGAGTAPAGTTAQPQFTAQGLGLAG